MLVLTRKKGESIRIGDSLVRVLEVRGRIVRLGIEAPEEIRILRTELEEEVSVGPQPPLRQFRMVGAA